MLKSYSFTKSSRLLKKAEFDFVFKSAKRLAQPAFTVLTRPNQLDRPRLGLIIAKKTAKKAVQRNRVKRITRETFRLNQHELPNVDMVVLSKKGISEIDSSELFKQFEKICAKLKR